MIKIMNWPIASLCFTMSSSLYAMEGQEQKDTSPLTESLSSTSTPNCLAQSQQIDFFQEVNEQTHLLIDKVLNSLDKATVDEIYRRRPKFTQEVSDYKNKVSKSIKKNFQDLFKNTVSDTTWQNEARTILSKLGFIMFFEKLNSNISRRKVGVPRYSFFKNAPLTFEQQTMLYGCSRRWGRYSWAEYEKTSAMLLHMLTLERDAVKNPMIIQIEHSYRLISSTIDLQINLMCGEKKNIFFTKGYRASILDIKKSMGILFFSFPEIIKQVEERKKEHDEKDPSPFLISSSLSSLSPPGADSPSKPSMHSLDRDQPCQPMPMINNGMAAPPILMMPQGYPPQRFYNAPPVQSHNLRPTSLPYPPAPLLARPDINQVDRDTLYRFLGYRKQELAGVKQFFAQMDQKMDDLSSPDQNSLEAIQSIYSVVSNFALNNNGNPHLLSHLAKRVEKVLNFIDSKKIGIDENRLEEYTLKFSGIKDYIDVRIDEKSVVYKKRISSSSIPTSRGNRYQSSEIESMSKIFHQQNPLIQAQSKQLAEMKEQISWQQKQIDELLHREKESMTPPKERPYSLEN